MHANITLIEQGPNETEPTIYLPGNELPSWLVAKLKDGNPGILVDDSEKSKTLSKAEAKNKTRGKPATMKDPEAPAVNLGYDGVAMAELEEIAIGVDIDPDLYSSREELVAALVKANAPKTITVSSAILDADD